MHGAAQWATLNNFFPGNTVVLMAHFDPDEVWRLVEQEKVNTLAITGDAMGRPLVDALGDGTRYDVSSLFAVSSSAAVFSPSVKQRFLEVLPNLIVTDAVGATETGFTGLTMVQKDEGARDGLNVKLGTDAIVVDDDGKVLASGSGQVGRLARTGNVPLGYYKDEEKTKATFLEVDGRRYALSGDWARLEEDGSMTLLGRGSQCINTGGEKVFPEEVEGVLKAHPAVFDCLVVGVPDERWGHRVTALVAPRPGAAITLEELQEHARRHLAGYKVPRGLHVADELPRHPSGKPDYPAAQRLVAPE
jgi:acyl-CoA synthetase (AMP-forming)/AMP-acid ligase II